MRSFLLFCDTLMVFVITSSLCLHSDNSSDNVDANEALYLTKYIENGSIQTARNLALVKHPDISIPSYAGYFTVNKTYNSNLFFWYIPAKVNSENVNSENVPVVLWLNGGPGASSLSGLLKIHGPFGVNSSLKLVPREYSWHLMANMIYIDSPAGTGFSFTDSDDGYANNQVDVGQNLLFALQQFFVMFPELQKNDFYATGESYGGKYVPAIGYAIHQDNKRNTNDSMRPKINLKGLAIGNPKTDPVHQLNFADYLYQLGLVDSNGHELIMDKQNAAIECIKNKDFKCATDITRQIISKDEALYNRLTGLSNFNYLKSANDAPKYWKEWLELPETRRAIHVGENPFNSTFSKVVEHLYLDKTRSIADWVVELLSNYPVMLYNGQLDVICAYPMMENFLKNLKFDAAEEYKTAKRHIWRVDDDVAGYVKYAGNLTEVLVRNAGHMVPMDQPKWAFDMITRFIQRKAFH